MQSKSHKKDKKKKEKKDRKRKRKHKKEKKKRKRKRKRKHSSDSSDEEIQRSVISGKRLKLKLDKTREDREDDMKRAELRRFLNSM